MDDKIKKNWTQNETNIIYEGTRDVGIEEHIDIHIERRHSES